MSQILNDDEEVVEKFEFSAGDIYITDRRLIVAKKKNHFDALLWKISSIRFTSEKNPDLLKGAVACFVAFFIIGLMRTAQFLGEVFQYSPALLFSDMLLIVLLLAGVGLLIVYFVLEEKMLRIFVEGAEEISVNTDSEVAIQISKLARHRNKDIKIET